MIRTFYLLGGTTKTITNATAGTINYNTGEVVLTSLNITSVSNADGTLSVTLKPDSNDIIPVRNQVIEIDTVGSSTTAEIDTFAEGTATAGVGYTTSSSTSSVGSAYTTTTSSDSSSSSSSSSSSGSSSSSSSGNGSSSGY